MNLALPRLTMARLIMASLVVLTVAACVIVVAESRRNPLSANRSREFQQLVGGLGFGPAVDLSRCTLAFDPRLGPVCESQMGPIPGGGFVCPQHACSVFDYSPAAETTIPQAEVTLDARVP